MPDQSFSPLKDKRKEWARFLKLLRILSKYGFSNFLNSSGLKKWVPNLLLSEDREKKKIANLTTSERIRLAIEDMGTTYIKFGQVISNRQDIFPKELIDELSKLQDRVPPIPDFDVNEHLREKYDSDLDDHFYSITQEPLAAASIAQVHRAVLNDEDHTEVIIKILRPGVSELIRSDIAVLKHMARFLKKNFPSMRKYQPMIVVETFEEMILKEINLSTELSNAQRFKAMFGDEPDIFVPKVYKQSSTRDVLVMEFIEGTKVSDLDDTQIKKSERKLLAKKGVRLFYKQIMEKGFYHSDPHPGNLFILDDGRISFIDFGMMGVILPEDQNNLGDLIFAISQDDPGEIVRMIKIIAYRADFSDEKKLAYQINDLLQQYQEQGIQEIDLRDLSNQLRKILHENDIVMPSFIFQLMRTMMIVEGIGFKLDPEFNIVTELEGYGKKIILEKARPKKLLLRGLKSIHQFDRLIQDLPSDLNDIIYKVKNDQLKLGVNIKERRKLERSLNKITNRIVIAILVAALTIGSAMIVNSEIPPFIMGMPIIGFIGFVSSGILTLFIVITIIRRDRF